MGFGLWLIVRPARRAIPMLRIALLAVVAVAVLVLSTAPAL